MRCRFFLTFLIDVVLDIVYSALIVQQKEAPLADQLQELVATAEAMIASQGVPRTPENIQRAVQMLAANPDLPRTQVARQTGLTRAPDQMYLGDGLDAAPVDAAGATVPPQAQGASSSAQPVQQAAPGAAQSSPAQAQQVPPDMITDDDEFEEIDPTTGVPLVLLPAAAAMKGNNADAMGMDIEGGQRALPGMEQRLALPGPGGSTLEGPNLDNPLLPSPQPTTINMPDQTSGPTITPEASFDQKMDARGTNVIDASPQLQIYRSKKTGNLFQINKVTGEVLDNAGRPLNSSAAQALLRTLRRI